MASGVPEWSVYRRLPSKMKEESCRKLGMEELDEDPERFVEAYLGMVVGQSSRLDSEEMGQLRVQPTLLDPSLKAPRASAPRRKTRKLSAKEKQALRLYDIPKDEQQYTMFLPLHALWVKYMTDLLQLEDRSINHSQLSLKVMKADYHGCFLKVCRSKCPSYVGTKGIVLQESQNTFKIIEEDNRLKTIPKAHSVFSFELRGLLFNLHGNHMRFRSSERSARKFKDKTSIDL